MTNWEVYHGFIPRVAIGKNCRMRIPSKFLSSIGFIPNKNESCSIFYDSELNRLALKKDDKGVVRCSRERRWVRLISMTKVFRSFRLWPEDFIGKKFRIEVEDGMLIINLNEEEE